MVAAYKDLSDKEKIEKLEFWIKHLVGNNQYFICGEAGSKDQVNLPDKIFVCPTYGAAGFAVYTKEKDYSEPGW